MRVLILYASAGNGHRRAAQAVYEAFINAGHNDVSMLDILDFTPKWFKAFYSRGYMNIVTHAKWLWRFAYHMSDKGKGQFFPKSWRSFLNKMMARKLVHFLEEYKPDVIVSTHFMANDVISRFKKEGCTCSLVSIVTDYTAHSFWVSDGVDHYFVAIDAVRDELISMGVDGNKITVSGIPVPQSFLKTGPREDLLGHFGLKDDFVALIIGGTVRTEMLIDTVKVLSRDMQMIVGCGKDTGLYDEIKPLEEVARGLKVYKIIDDMTKAMSVADAIVTKPGGLVVTEALTKRVPMILVDPIPGQEDGNRKIMAKLGAAFTGDNSIEVIKYLTLLKSSQEERERMKSAMQGLAQGDVAGRMFSHIIEMYGKLSQNV